MSLSGVAAGKRRSSASGQKPGVGAAIGTLAPPDPPSLTPTPHPVTMSAGPLEVQSLLLLTDCVALVGQDTCPVPASQSVKWAQP